MRIATGIPTSVSAINTTATGVAIVTRLVDVEWDGDDMAFDVGDALPPGRVAIASGFAQVEFFCGATIVLEGPAELDVESARCSEVDESALEELVFDLPHHQPGRGRCQAVQPAGELGLVRRPLVRSRRPIERVVMNGAALIVQLIAIRPHRGEKERDFLLVVPNVRAQTEILRNEEPGVTPRLDVREREQLVAEDDEGGVAGGIGHG